MDFQTEPDDTLMIKSHWFWTFLMVGLIIPVVLQAAPQIDSSEWNPLSDPPNNLHEKPDFPPGELEREIHNLVNERRRQHGRSPVTYDARLAKLARKHSRDMIERGYFHHIDPDGRSPSDRAEEMGIQTRRSRGRFSTSGIAENISHVSMYRWVVVWYGTTYHWRTLEEMAQTVVSSWMESPGHRQNLLNPHAKREGIGVAITNEFTVYVTQNLR